MSSERPSLPFRFSNWKELDRRHFGGAENPRATPSIGVERSSFVGQLGELARSGARRSGQVGTPNFHELEVADTWSRIAQELRVVARFKELRQDRLVVEVSGSAAAQDLGLQRPRLMERLNQEESTREIRKLLVEVRAQGKTAPAGGGSADNESEPLTADALQVLDGLGDRGRES